MTSVHPLWPCQPRPARADLLARPIYEANAWPSTSHTPSIKCRQSYINHFGGKKQLAFVSVSETITPAKFGNKSGCLPVLILLPGASNCPLI